jgi:hypothetical protein
MDRPCTPTGIGHQKKLEQVLIYGRTGRLNEIDIVTAHTLLEFDMEFTIGKTL